MLIRRLIYSKGNVQRINTYLEKLPTRIHEA